LRDRCRAAIVPPAPGRFSTTTADPVLSRSFSAISRAVVSAGPPAGKPTWMLMVLGNDEPCPYAVATGSKAVALPIRKVRRDNPAFFSIRYPTFALSVTGGR